MAANGKYGQSPLLGNAREIWIARREKTCETKLGLRSVNRGENK